MYLQSHISKNISVSFDFITTWNQGLFLCSSCIIEPNCVSLAKFVTEPNRILLSQIVYYWAKSYITEPNCILLSQIVYYWAKLYITEPNCILLSQTKGNAIYDYDFFKGRNFS